MNTVIDVMALNTLDRNEEYSFKAFRYVDYDGLSYTSYTEDDEGFNDFVYYAETKEYLYELLMEQLNPQRTSWNNIPLCVEDIVVTTSIKSIPEEDRVRGHFASFTLFCCGSKYYKYDFKEHTWKL